MKFLFTVSVEVEPCEDDAIMCDLNRVRASVKQALTNAMDHAYNEGFDHDLESVISIKPLRVNFYQFQDYPEGDPRHEG